MKRTGERSSEPFDSSTFESSLQHVEDVLATSPVVLYSAELVDRRLVPFWVSSNVAAVLGYSVEDVLAEGWWWRNVHPDDRAAASVTGAALLAQKHYAHEYRFRHAKGAYVWVLDQIKLLTRDDGSIVVGSWTDVSTNRRERDQLEVAERHYRRLVQTSPYGIYAVDATGRFVEMNRAGELILGRTDLIGTSFIDVIAPISREATIEVFEGVLAGAEEDLEFEVWIARPDGTERLLVISATAIRDGGTTGVHGIARDITEDRRITNEREEARRHYERLVTTSPYAIYALDLEGRFTEVNDSTARLLGRSADELLGQPFASVVAPEDLTRARRSFQSKVRDEVQTTEIELRLLRPDGARRLVRIRATQINDGGVLVGSHGIGEDITEARAHEERMRMFAAALEQLPDGVCITNNDGVVVYTNAAWHRLLAGGSGAVPDPFGCAADGDTLRTAMSAALTKEGMWRGTLTCADPRTGVHRPIELVAAQVVLADATHTFSLVRDLTDEVERETHLRRAERLASVGTLVAGVAHELNNPLTAIAGFAELMLMDPRSDDDAEMLKLTLREANRAARIVADLRLLARETQDAPADSGAVDLNDVVRHVMKLQRYTLDTSNIEVVEDLAAGLPAVHGRVSELEQVVLNLVVNARQALSDRTLVNRTITVQTRPSRAGALLRISDNGPGIPQDNLERIFDPFFTTKSPGEGMGLGLSLVHRIVAEHDGQLQVESATGAGASFTVTLPPARARERAAPTRTSASVTALRILVVDDEEPIRRAVSRFLLRRGHTVDVAGDGVAALHLIERHTYDVIVSDLRMPGMGGEALLDTLRERDPPAARRVIFMTGHVSHDDVPFTADYPDVPLIEKPFSLNELGTCIDEVAARTKRVDGTTQRTSSSSEDKDGENVRKE